MFKQLGADGESFFLTALGDEEAEVRQTAAAYLGEIRSTHPQALEFYSRVLLGDDEAGVTEADAVLVQVCVALENISIVADDGVAGAQHMLMGGLNPIERKGVRNLLKKSAPRHTDRVREAIYQTLGRIGTRDVLESLEKIAATEVGALAEIAAAACRELEQRTSITASLRFS